MQLYALNFPGSASVPGMPQKDYSDAEGEVANIASLKRWPGLFEWDVSTGAILDRNTAAVIPSYGVSQPSAKFVTLPNGKRGYQTVALADTLIPAFSTTGSFTIGCTCAIALAFGSYAETELNTSVPAPWGVYSDVSPTGLVTMVFGPISVASSVANAWPIKLAADKMTAVVLIFDRTAGTLTVRYNGQQMYQLADVRIKTMVLHNELMIGGQRIANNGTSRAIATRPLTSNAFAAFESALSGTELASLEKMLMEAAASA